VAQGFTPLAEQQMQALRERYAAVAGDGCNTSPMRQRPPDELLTGALGLDPVYLA
jgi:hypothetical protein